MSSDQATQLREMMASPQRTQSNGQVRVLAIASGKGGVGKTNVAVNLAARLGQMGRRVMLLDADMGLANADVLCNVTVRANLAHVVAGRKQLQEALLRGPGGFVLVPGASGLSQMAALSEFERARIIEMIGEIKRQYDLVLLDTGAGISPNVLSFAETADEVIVVSTPEPTAITDAYALIKTLIRRRESLCVGLLVNMVRDRDEARRVYDRLNAVCRRFLGLTLTDAGYLVNDPRVAVSVKRRVPFVLDAPDAPASACISRLAHKLDRYASQPHRRGFFRRFASWLAG